MKIFYLGPDGSFSYLLAQKVFVGKNFMLNPCDSFGKIVDNIFQEEGAIGILGIENSGSSSVHEAVDLVFENDLHIVGEASMEISLNLIGLSDSKIEDVTDVYSHEQALAQARKIIDRYNWKVNHTQSTKAAVKYIFEKNNPKNVALAGKSAVSENVTILEKDVSDYKNNMTRWIFVSSKSISQDRKINKQTYIFTIKHIPGSLVRVLQKIAELGGNMTKIESRPQPGSNWEYQFWVDIEIPEGLQDKFKAMMEKETEKVRLVGSYSQGKLYHE